MHVQRIATRQITTQGEAGHLHHSTQYPHPAQKLLTPAFIPPPIAVALARLKNEYPRRSPITNFASCESGSIASSPGLAIESIQFAPIRDEGRGA
jgi:hypothetical protein